MNPSIIDALGECADLLEAGGQIGPPAGLAQRVRAAYEDAMRGGGITAPAEEPAEPKPRPRFMAKGIATIKHLNVRKEGPDDEKILAVDLKLQFEKLGREICDYFDEALAAFLWKPGDGMFVRNAFLQPVAFLHELENATITIDGKFYGSCDVKKCSVTPRDGGQVDFVCSVSFLPSADEVAELAKRVQDGARIEIEGPLDLFDGEGGAKAAGNEARGE